LTRRSLIDRVINGFSRGERGVLLAGLAGTTLAVGATRVAHEPTWVRFWDNVHWTLAYAFATALAWLSMRRAHGNLARARRWFTIGLAALTAGQLVWDVQVAIGWNPFPGPSDALYVTLGPFLGLGVLALAGGQPRTRRISVALDGLGFALALLALTLATYLPRRGDFSSFTLAVLAAYPTFLLSVTALLVVVVCELREPPSAPLLLLGAAVLGQGLLWMTWNLATLDNTLGDGRVINYLFSYGVLALGAAVALYEPSGTEVEGPLARAYYLVSRLVPLGLVVAASTAVVASGGLSHPARLAVETCMGGVIVVAVARQSLLLEDRERQLATEAHFREVEQRLSQAQRLESLGTLAGGIAHDFNNVLTGILGHVEFLAQARGLPRDAIESVDGVRAGAIRARDVTRRILSFSRYDPAPPEAVKARALVEEVIALLRAALPARHVLELRGAERLYLRGSPAQIHQVLMNLGTNASQAIGAQPGTIVFGVAARQLTEAQGSIVAGDYVELSVTDDGIGMDAATQKRIFEPFFTTKPREQGTGLGLSVVHGIVTEHGGAIVVESTPGAGTTVRVLLPAVAAVEASPAPPPVSQSSEPATQKFLIVDDEAAIGSILTRLLRLVGQPAEYVTSPEAALALIRRDPEQFWLVVTDMSMPTMNGLELGYALREIAPRLVLVLSSGTDFVVAGTPFDDVLPKPYTVDTLTTLIARHRATTANDRGTRTGDVTPQAPAAQ
jgi:signal transduction histidine kinase/CheY-like chemotaxis protein